MMRLYFLLLHLVRRFVKRPLGWLLRPKGRESGFRMGRWAQFVTEAHPPLRRGKCRLFGKDFIYNDSFWFVHQCEEILNSEIYRFTARSNAPVILDCGANVGLSVLYFKRLYSGARVTAFEPDPAIFAMLQQNVSAYGLGNVALHQKAIWTAEGTMNFEADGSVGGHLSGNSAGQSVATTRLRSYLEGPIDFLKIDIEGAEVAVLRDCANRLEAVEHLFIEYHSQTAAPQELPELLMLLREAGFRYYIKEASALPHPFATLTDKAYSYRMDLQLNIFAYRKPAAAG